MVRAFSSGGSFQGNTVISAFGASEATSIETWSGCAVTSSGSTSIGVWQDFAKSREILAKHCADIGRNVDEIMTSTHLRLDPNNIQATVDEAAALAEAGLDLGIVYLPPPHTPAILEPLASALSPLAG